MRLPALSGVPEDAEDAIRAVLGEEAEGLDGKDLYVAFLQSVLQQPLRQIRRQARSQVAEEAAIQKLATVQAEIEQVKIDRKTEEDAIESGISADLGAIR